MRLTVKQIDEIGEPYYIDKESQLSTSASDKLGILEDIEEELGINLIVLSKALKQGYIVDLFYNEQVRSLGEETLLVDFSNKCFYNCFVAGKYDKCYYFEDYEKEWGL